jgi:6-phosphogluconolactonase
VLKNTEVHIYQDTRELVKSFTEYVERRIGETEGPFHVALSGGNTPKAWFDYLADQKATKIPWKKIHFYWGDERCVPPDHPESNYGMTKKHLFDHIPVPESDIHRICGECVPKEAAVTYGNLLSATLPVRSLPQFDLVILGLGDDGHTASIFPHEIDLWDSDEICVVATHPVSGQHRISLSGRLINNAKEVAFLITGIAKADKVNVILNESPESANYPAALVKSKITHWFLDKDAASLLKL